MRSYSKKFIEIQIRFAERLVELANDKFTEVLAAHTVFRQILGVSIGGEHHNDSLWQEFVNGVAQQSDAADWAYNFYLKQPEPVDESKEPRFGCFKYDYWFQPVVRLHFDNLTYESVLDKESVDSRQIELKRLFNHV